ncbi:MAG TPA: OadG family protein [Clostridiales bacterium]|nr:OadG family protein [Clostridiales bacterium]
MTVIESLPYALFCMAVVFAALIALCLIIKVFSFLFGRMSGEETNSGTTPQAAIKAAPQTVSTNQVSGTSSGQLTLKGVDEPTAAIIMAVISEDLGMPLEQLSFKSIKLVK